MSGMRGYVCSGALGDVLCKVYIISELRRASLKWTMAHDIGPGLSAEPDDGRTWSFNASSW